MRICMTVDYYTPAHKAGGPIPGVTGLIRSLEGAHSVHVLTSDRDLGDAEPFPEPYRGTLRVGEAMVTYLPPMRPSKAWFKALRLAHTSDVLHVNSLHSKGFTLLPLLWLAATGYRGRVLISPRGELASTALKLGNPRLKKAWGRVMRGLRLWRSVGRCGNVTWVASSRREVREIRAAYPDAAIVVVPETLRPAPIDPLLPHHPPAAGEELRIVSVGRIAPVKGTVELIRGLADVETPAVLHLVGVAADPNYLAEVKAAEATLPAHVRVEHHGSMAPAELFGLLRTAHLFALLSHGENYGHAIGEALQQGCPVLLSDQTPWTFACADAGQALTPAECRDAATVARAVNDLMSAGAEKWKAMSAAAQEAGRRGVEDPDAVNYADVIRCEAQR